MKSMMMMVGGDGGDVEDLRKVRRWKLSKVIFGDFVGDLDDPGVQDIFSFYSKRSSFQVFSVFAILDCTHYNISLLTEATHSREVWKKLLKAKLKNIHSGRIVLR